MTKKSENTNNRKSIYRRLFRVLLFVFLGLLVLLIIASVVFYTNKDTIAENILLSANEKQEGELCFKDISFNPFVQFPSVSIQLNDVQYFEKKQVSVNPNFKVGVDTIARIDTLSSPVLPIAQFQELYAAISITDLMRSEINISKVLVRNGQVNIIRYSDSTYNLLNALNPILKDTTNIAEENKVKKDTAHLNQEYKDLNLLLDLVSFKNIQVSYFDSTVLENSAIKIDKIIASLKYDPDSIACEVISELQIVELGVTKDIIIKNKSLKLNTNVTYDRSEKNMVFAPSFFQLEATTFQFSGDLDLKDKGFVDLEITGSDQNFGFSNLLLSETGLNQIKNGNIYFNGSIKGKLTEAIPIFDFSFGIEDADIHIPTANSDISKINMEGKFNSGTKRDFSQAKLSIKNLKAQLPGGYLNANCSVENFATPDFSLDWDMKTDVTGFEDIFRLGFIDSLSGNLTIKDHLIAQYDPASKWIVSEESYTQIKFDSMFFNIPDVLNVSGLSGALIGDNDTLRLENVKILTGNTDLLINGEVYNLISLFFNNDQNISSNLSIKSNVFDLAELLAYDPRIGENFPYQIVDIDLIVNAITSTAQLTDFNTNPEIDFEIEQLDAEIQNFLPPVSISQGLFKLHEKDKRILLNFNDFDITMEGANINADVEYYSPTVDPDYVNTKVQIESLSPGRILYYGSADTIPDALNGLLDGSLICDVTLSNDTNVLEKVYVDKGNLAYHTKKDTFSIKSLNLDAEKIYYNLDKKPNPLATLTTKCIIKAEEISTDILDVKDVKYELDINHGEFVIIPEQISFFGEEGKGKFILKPYIELPTYKLEYEVDQFQVEKLLTSFLEDSIITGKADFRLDISMKGDYWDSIVGNLNGQIYLKGNNLKLWGLDADKLIEELKRSQNFNLVDVGAVILAGPVGLAVSKGSDYARIFISKPGESTEIPSFMSDWEVVNGKMTMKDVAFSTKNNRIAAQGWIDLTIDKMDMTIAALNKDGCSIMSQDLKGKLSDPKMGEVQVVKSIIAPVTNLVKGAVGVNCKVFYEGDVKHPVKQKKK